VVIMERKKKVCKGCGEDSYLWAYGKCKKCHMLGKGKPKYKRTVIKPTKRHVKVKDAEYAMMSAKWEALKMDGDVCCWECGKYLGEEMEPMHMAHVLSKGAYPMFRCDMRNVVPMCAVHHQMMDGQVDGKIRSDMDCYDMLESIAEDLKSELYLGK